LWQILEKPQVIFVCAGFLKMNKSYFIELTNKLYRLTFFFPQKEPLRHKIREVGDEVLANLVLILEGEIEKRRESAFNVERNIEILDSLLELSKMQNWIDSEQIGKLQSNYKEIKKEVEEFNDILRRKTAFYEGKALMIGEEEKKEEKPKLKTFSNPKKKAPVKLNPRQEKIMSILQKRNKIQVKDIQEVLPKATKRTLRRDLSAMMDKKMIKREGKGNTTYYSLKEGSRESVADRT